MSDEERLEAIRDAHEPHCEAVLACSGCFLLARLAAAEAALATECAAREALQAELEGTARMHARNVDLVHLAQAERDEAQAEVARLTEALDAARRGRDAEVGYLRDMARSYQETAEARGAECDRLRMAVGLLSTLAPNVEMNVLDPLAMAQEIVQAVNAESERLRGERDEWRGKATVIHAVAESLKAERDDARRRLALLREPTPEMVERVARAAHDAEYGAGDFGLHPVGHFDREVALTQARAALRAVAECVEGE